MVSEQNVKIVRTVYDSSPQATSMPCSPRPAASPSELARLDPVALTLKPPDDAPH
jgi:hypothetical protein